LSPSSSCSPHCCKRSSPRKIGGRPRNEPRRSKSFALHAASKASLLGLLQRRHLAARAAAASDPAVRERWQRLSEVRRTVGRLQLEDAKDPSERDRRLADAFAEQTQLERALAPILSDGAAARKTPVESLRSLAEGIPAGTVYIDFALYHHANDGPSTTPRYLVFVVAKGQPTRRIELGEAAPIDAAIAAWRRDIANLTDQGAPEVLTATLWRKLAPAIPAGTTKLLLSPAGNLARLPFAALPGSKPGSVLLEDMAVAVVPGAVWLADRGQSKNRGDGHFKSLTVGGVDYGGELTSC